MHFFEVIKRRRSIRAFRKKPLMEETLQAILAAANAAPSAHNRQSYEIYVVTGDLARMALAHAADDQFFVAGAPVSLIFCTHGESAGRLYTIQDATIACTFAMLAATALGLGSVWVGAFQPAEVRRIVGAPPGIEPVAILPIGYPAEEPPAPGRRSLDDLVHRVG